MARSVPTLIAPADSPKMVTLDGSPPNAAMFSRTHRNRRTEPIRAERRRREWHSEKRVHTVNHDAAQGALPGVDDCIHARNVCTPQTSLLGLAPTVIACRRMP